MATIIDIEGKQFTLKSPGEVTLGDWADLTNIEVTGEDDTEANIELVKRHTKIPKKLLRKLPMSEADKLIAAVADIMTEAMTIRSKEFEVPTEYTFKGMTYTVPHDLEKQTVSGQWWDLQKAKEIKHEAECIARCLGALLVPVGQEYDGLVSARAQAFMGMPLADAFGLSAFFFDRSERFRNATNHLSTLLVSYANHKRSAALRNLPRDTASTTTSTKPQGTSRPSDPFRA